MLDPGRWSQQIFQLEAYEKARLDVMRGALTHRSISRGPVPKRLPATPITLAPKAFQVHPNHNS